MRSKDIFYALCDKWRRREFDDEYLTLAVKLRDKYPESELFSLFYGFYALAYGNIEVAFEQAQLAYARRHLSEKVWQLLLACYEAMGMERESIFFQGLRRKFYNVPLSVEIKDRESLDLLSMAMGVGNYAPFAAERLFYRNGELQQQAAVFAGEFLPSLNRDHYWVGAYAEQEGMEGKNWLLSEMRENSDFAKRCGADFVFDIQRASLAKRLEIVPPTGGALLPVAGTDYEQRICFTVDGELLKAGLGKWMFGYFRLTRPVVLQSDRDMVVGKIIPLGHSPKRKKVVLNILVDAFSWAVEKERGFRDVPNIMKFFSKGIIFNNHFSVGEYTYPSFATIETGMTPHHSQIFNEQAAVPLAAQYTTISEQMQQLGYYCVNIMGSGDGIYNETTRGYDRLLVNSYAVAAYEGVERTIRHLESFDCDQFLLMHVMDVHPWRARDYQVPVTTQTSLPLEERVDGYDESRPSVYIKYTPLYEKANIDGLRNTDRALGNLFQYLEEHYKDDEYIVQLYSDHGCSVYDDNPYLLSDHHVGAAYMIRGAGVPKKGRVEELTSSLDIYPVLGRLTGFAVPDYVDGNLPAALGGREREYVISNTMYPGQTFKMAIRTQDYECQLQTTDLLTTAGTVNMDTAEFKIYRRDKEYNQVENPERKNYFTKIVNEYTKTFDNHGIQ